MDCENETSISETVVSEMEALEICCFLLSQADAHWANGDKAFLV